MHFPDLTGRYEVNPAGVPLQCLKVEAKRLKGTPSWLWTFHLEARLDTEADSLPALPKAFRPSRDNVVQALSGGVAVDLTLKKFQISGKITLCPLTDGEVDVDAEAANQDPCEVIYANLFASENVCRVRYRVVVTADSSKAQEILELTGSAVHLLLEPSAGQPQLDMFALGGDENEAPDNVVDLPVEAGDDQQKPSEKSKRPRTRRGGAKARNSRLKKAAEGTAHA